MSNKHEEKQQKEYRAALDRLLQDPANRVCSDCGSAGPRWASPKLGIFICMKCAGIHRSLGVHISFVRSVTLDKWKESEVQDMHPGNGKAAAIFEATLPDNFPRPYADGIALEKFIRNKYVHKRFMLPGGEPKSTPVPAPAPQVPVQPAKPVEPVRQATQPIHPPKATPAPTPGGANLLGDIFSTPAAPPAAQNGLQISPALFPVQGQVDQETAKNNIMNLFATPQPNQFASPPAQYSPQVQFAPQQAQYAQNQYAAHLAQAQQAQQQPAAYYYQQWPGFTAQPQPDAGGLEILSKIQSISQENRGHSGQVYF